MLQTISSATLEITRKKIAKKMALPGFWQPLKNQPIFLHGAGAPMLLTDGSIMFRDQFFGVPSDLSSVNNGYQPIWKLTPDHHGSYVNGTWSELASLPGNYAPAFYASAVLPDSLVVFAGGEVNGENNFVWQGTCAIYDPVKDKWKFFDPPPFFYNLYPNIQSQHPIGDAQSVVLEDGTWMIASSITNQQALLDAKTLTWKPTGAGKFDGNDEEGWSLLPDGTVLTVDCYVNQSSPGFLNNTNSEIYDPKPEPGTMLAAPLFS